jgi:integrase
MARTAKKLSAREAATKKPGRYGDGDGLYLVVGANGGRKWVFRFSWRGKVTEAGLGSADAVTLAEARAKADEARKLLAAGTNPIENRRKAASVLAAKPTFGDVADDLIEAKASEWRNEKHRAQWAMTLSRYCASLRSRPVEEIDTEAVLSVLKPIWRRTPETASRLRGRIEMVLDAARARGHIPRNEANPARWRGHLDKLLPKRPNLSRGHHAAMPYAEVPGFLRDLKERDGFAAMALELCILTATRSGEIYGARWDEIDLENRVWTIPATRMKAGREHRIPLSGPAMDILERVGEVKSSDLVFPGRGGRSLSNMAMKMVLRRMGVNITAHGFRSSFRDWAGNESDFSREVAEAALAHVVGDKAEQAYRRGDALEKRRQLMHSWANFCVGVTDETEH